MNFVRLSGPLQVKRVVPIHNYTGVLPFQGSINLGDREVLTVRSMTRRSPGWSACAAPFTTNTPAAAGRLAGVPALTCRST